MPTSVSSDGTVVSSSASDGTIIATDANGKIHAGIPVGYSIGGDPLFANDLLEPENVYMGGDVDSVPAGSGANPLDVPNVGHSSGIQAATARIRQLQDEIAQLRASASSRGAIYRNSGIDIYDDNNNLVFHAGPDGTTIKENLTLGANIIGKNALANQLHISGYKSSVQWASTTKGKAVTPISKNPTDYCPLYVTPPDFATSAFITYAIDGALAGLASTNFTPYLASQTGETFTRQTNLPSSQSGDIEFFALSGQCLVPVDKPDSSGKLALGVELSRSDDGTMSYTPGDDVHYNITINVNFTVFWCAEGVITDYDQNA